MSGTIQVRVASLATAQQLSLDWADGVVSLVNPGTDLPPFNTFHLVVPMHDTDVITDAWSPKLDDIQRVFQFALSHHNILVHCEGGISRSTAMSIGLLVRDGVSVVDACTQVHAMSPNMAPNYLILDHIDNHLQLGGTLSKQVRAVMDTFPKDLMLWCRECNLHFKDGDNCPGKHWS